MKKSLTNHVKHSSSSYARNPRTQSIASRLEVSGHFEHSSPSCARTKFHFVNPRSGFTLIELMVSLALGLIIVAAATQLFITGLTSYKLQKAMAHIQDSASFGLNFIVDDIRKANLSSPMPAVNDQIAYSGIILTSKNVGSKINLNCTACFSDNKLTSFGNANVTGLANDQLLIRYRSPQDGFDCSGNTTATNTFVVQRYFVGSTSTDLRQSLRCQAAQYTQAQLDAATEANPLLLSWSASQVILPNVDFFQVRLGYIDGELESANSSLAYTDIKNYMALSAKTKNIDGVVQTVRPHVHAVQIGVLVQSADSAGHQSIIKDRNKQPFQVLGTQVTLTPTYQDTRLRQVVDQTISLRNAMGWVTEGCDSSKTTCTGGA
ncbi:prepilin-type N-terminal cleavage/methylation domain-containing protein [Acinetobacter haemolyticus]|uniref:PilW family protein n=1 Tax=Acinetobacter haemolyticus TaxID=29430 RepID=UPI001372ECFE|nr:PilW family protein [Acinetobacter haemolyticus]NAR62658.1 prepilin-type N-terminal cleavage/methylation domain-containing protein [Acinetobacter haemolyticus]